MYGPEGVQFYSAIEVVTSRWPDPGASKVDLGFPQNPLESKAASARTIG